MSPPQKGIRSQAMTIPGKPPGWEPRSSLTRPYTFHNPGKGVTLQQQRSSSI